MQTNHFSLANITLYLGWFLRLKIETSENSSPQSSDMKLTGFLDCVNFRENVLKKERKIKPIVI